MAEGKKEQKQGPLTLQRCFCFRSFPEEKQKKAKKQRNIETMKQKN